MNEQARRNIQAAAQMILSAKWPIALTGAGISVDSGIPDFRSVHGLWSRFDPMEYGTIEAFRRNPVKVWKMLKELASTVIEAHPNPGHEGLARLEKMGLLKAIITQNVDNLHQEAGSREVIEFHGNGNQLVCLSCHGKFDVKQATEKAESSGDWPPECPACAQVLKPDVVLFGEMIPHEALTSSQLHAAKADLILVLGTSATVAPASGIPIMVKQNGGKIIEFNLSQTQLSSLADLIVGGSTSSTVPAFVEEIEKSL